MAIRTKRNFYKKILKMFNHILGIPKFKQLQNYKPKR